jgi:hypothetical protein
MHRLVSVSVFRHRWGRGLFPARNCYLQKRLADEGRLVKTLGILMDSVGFEPNVQRAGSGSEPPASWIAAKSALGRLRVQWQSRLSISSHH